MHIKGLFNGEVGSVAVRTSPSYGGTVKLYGCGVVLYMDKAAAHALAGAIFNTSKTLPDAEPAAAYRLTYWSRSTRADKALNVVTFSVGALSVKAVTTAGESYSFPLTNLRSITDLRDKRAK